MKVAVVGAGWGGMAAAVQLSAAGHGVTVFEASRSIGGRARSLACHLPDATELTLDNGQHILIGAYTRCLSLMQQVGIPIQQALLELPLTLKFADGMGLEFPKLPAPLDALAGILKASGWGWRDKSSLLQAALGWQFSSFSCAASLSVSDLCRGLTQRVQDQLIEPLCISALNTPAREASASVFLRVLKDAVFGVSGGSRLLLPRMDLSALFPLAAQQFLLLHQGQVLTGQRVTQMAQTRTGWRVNQTEFDAVLLATSCSDAIHVVAESMPFASENVADLFRTWSENAQSLRYEAITTVYAWARQARLARPMLTLRCKPHGSPAQFVFDRGQLGGPAGLLAFVVSASPTERLELQAQVLQQAQSELGLQLQAVQTVVEKRATFACTPGLMRPTQTIAPGLLAVGDYVEGPYPATLEGTVRSAQAAVLTLMENAEKPIRSQRS